jgi:hypothetical protein
VGVQFKFYGGKSKPFRIGEDSAFWSKNLDWQGDNLMFWPNNLEFLPIIQLLGAKSAG